VETAYEWIIPFGFLETFAVPRSVLRISLSLVNCNWSWWFFRLVDLVEWFWRGRGGCFWIRFSGLIKLLNKLLSIFKDFAIFKLFLYLFF